MEKVGKVLLKNDKGGREGERERGRVGYGGREGRREGEREKGNWECVCV